MNSTYTYFKQVIVKYNCNKVKKHVHTKHSPKYYFLSSIYQSLLDGYFMLQRTWVVQFTMLGPGQISSNLDNYKLLINTITL